MQIALALVALLATVVPDVRGLPGGRYVGDQIGFATSDQRSEEALNALHSALRSLDKFNEGFDEDGDPRLSAVLCLDPSGAAKATSVSGWVLPSRRPCAYQAIAPPSADA